MKTLRPEMIYTCVGCGMHRYYVTKPCPTCTRLANAGFLGRR